MQIDNHVLTIEDFTQELPGLATTATVTAWRVPVEYQASGYFIAINVPGQPATLPACDSNDATLVGTLELSASPAAQLAQAKAERLAAINIECDKALAVITASYPSSEVSSWPQQVQEAKAITADPAAEAPLLVALAEARAIAVAELAARVLIKAEAFSVISGQIIGRRQALEDTLSLTATPEDIAEVAW